MWKGGENMNHEIDYPESEITQTNRQLTEAGINVAKPTENEPEVIKRLRQKGYEFEIVKESERNSRERNPI